ncbi:alpha/beta hydrolase family protein [Endothiovibrio diazotrophicus]
MLRLPVLLFLISVSAAFGAVADGIYSADGRLYLPWVEVAGSIYAAELEARGDAFVLTALRPRGAVADEAQPAVARLEGDLLEVPRLQYDGRIYQAELRLSGDGGEATLTVEGVAPAAEPADRGVLVAVEAVGEESLSTLSALLPFWPSGVSPLYGVTLLRITYRTADPFGSSTEASALLALPQGAEGALPLLSYQHGTLLLRDEAPSTGTVGDGYLVAALFASAGYAAVAPDYLGLGVSDGLHPFVHGPASANAVVDALRAARATLADRGVALDGSLFLTGYSEGGYVTLAAQRAIEQQYGDEFTLTASAPMAGPYDLSGTMRERVLAGTPHEEPYYFPYQLFAYDRVYGLFDDDGEAFAGELATTLRALYDGTHDQDEINAVLPSVPAEALGPELLAALRDEPDAPLNLALVANDLIDWAPQTPTRLYHCNGDASVPFANSRVAYDAFVAHGATQVELEELEGDDHAGCAPFALLYGAAWFASLR